MNRYWFAIIVLLEYLFELSFWQRRSFVVLTMIRIRVLEELTFFNLDYGWLLRSLPFLPFLIIFNLTSILKRIFAFVLLGQCIYINRVNSFRFHSRSHGYDLDVFHFNKIIETNTHVSCLETSEFSNHLFINASGCALLSINWQKALDDMRYEYIIKFV